MPAGGKFGRLQPAPENFISTELIDDIRDHGLNDSRREFLRKSLAAASAALAAGTSLAAADHPGGEGDPAITKLDRKSTRLNSSH